MSHASCQRANDLVQGLRLIIGRLKIPCYPNASLAPKDSKYPLIIFSHGLAGTRHTYTQYCSALASRGYVVLALEHRDGSAPAVLLPSKPASIGSDESGKSEKKKEPKQRVLSYTKKDEIEWQGGEAGTLEKFRTLQLEMRVREVYEAYHSFSRWVKGDLSGFDIEHSEKVKMGEFQSSFENKVDFEKIDLIGHSFGAGTVVRHSANQACKPLINQLHLLGQPVPDSAYSMLPVQRAIALDPWVEPIPKPTESTPSPSQDQPPVLIINSPGFTVWDSHFHRLLDMTKRINGSLVTIIGINRMCSSSPILISSTLIPDQSFSDFPLLSPSSPSTALGYLHTIHELSSSFLEGAFAENNTIKDLQPDGGDFARGSDGKMDGANGSVVLHFLGKQT